jgi:hypothetical protein
MGTQWPEPGFEVDITIRPSGRIVFGAEGCSYYLLEGGMVARAKRPESRSVVTVWKGGRCLEHRIVSPEGRVGPGVRLPSGPQGPSLPHRRCPTFLEAAGRSEGLGLRLLFAASWGPCRNGLSSSSKEGMGIVMQLGLCEVAGLTLSPAWP